MDDQTIIQEMDIDDLPDEYREVAETIGLDMYMDLIEYYGGSCLYLPTVKTVLKEMIYKRIISEYNGFNKRELIKKYDVSSSTINRIIKRNVRKGELQNE